MNRLLDFSAAKFTSSPGSHTSAGVMRVVAGRVTCRTAFYAIGRHKPSPPAVVAPALLLGRV
jgi:hypothetical protein